MSDYLFLVPATGAGIAWALSNIIDEIQIDDEDRFHTSASIATVGSIMAVILMIPILLLWYFSDLISSSPVLPQPRLFASILSGFIYVPAVYLYLRSLDGEVEISRLAPLMEISPIVTLLLAVSLPLQFGGEGITLLNTIGIILIVGATMLVSPSVSDIDDITVGTSKPFQFIILLSVLFGVFAVLTSYAIGSESASVWWVYFWARIAGIVPTAILIYKLDILSRFKASFRDFTETNTHIVGFNEGINYIGVALVTWAFSQARSPLVDAASSTSPLWVLLVAVTLSKFDMYTFDEEMTNSEEQLKFISAVVIVIGVYLITF